MVPYASIIIPTRNGMPLAADCLRAVLAQETPWPFEVIVIDSGSSDGTWDLLESLPVKRMQIAPQSFNHGGTRNLGASTARGQFLVFLVQDAVPGNNSWLASLVTACDQDSVAGTFSRQLVRPESDPVTRFLCSGTTPVDPRREIKSLPTGKRLADLTPRHRFHLALFQNASSCMRKAVWMDYPFATLPYGEDIEWGKRVIEAGYSIVYEPSSVVYHSHDRPPLYTLKRSYADHYQVSELFDYVLVPSPRCLLREAVSSILRSWRYIVRSEYRVTAKLRFAVVAPMHLVSLAVGEYLGARMCHRSPQQKWAERVDRALRVGV